MTMDDAIRLAIEAVKKASGNDLLSSNIKVAIIPAKTKLFKRLSQKEVEQHLT
jgi:20S proteasome alpha/beta subunit